LAQAQAGDTVKVHYTGTLDDGTVFDSSQDRDPIEFTLGQKQVIDGFDTAVTGMEVGETRSVSLTPDEAYGQPRDELVGTVDRDRLPEELTPEVGMFLQAQSPDGQVNDVKITDVSDDTITIDANHPLAGQNLHFDLTLVSIG